MTNTWTPERAREYNLAYQRRRRAGDPSYGKSSPDQLRAYNRRYYLKRRQMILETKDSPCMDCGLKFPPCAMDFDHVRGEKKFNIALSVAHPPDAIVDEMAKCDLVCANCHRIRTKRRQGMSTFVNPTHALKNNPCSDCARCWPPEAMDFDHQDPATKFRNVSALISCTTERILEEVAKCDLVCANCHRIRTQRRLDEQEDEED